MFTHIAILLLRELNDYYELSDSVAWKNLLDLLKKIKEMFYGYLETEN